MNAHRMSERNSRFDPRSCYWCTLLSRPFTKFVRPRQEPIRRRTLDLAPAAPSRRERLRAQTHDEIKAATRAQLAAYGYEGVQLRAVAREVGLTAPRSTATSPASRSWSRRSPSTSSTSSARSWRSPRQPARGDVGRPDAGPEPRFPRYAIAHPHEFALLFASPPSALGQQSPTPATRRATGSATSSPAPSSRRVGRRPVPGPTDDSLADALVQDLHRTGRGSPPTSRPNMPLGAVVSFLEGWMRIFGSSPWRPSATSPGRCPTASRCSSRSCGAWPRVGARARSRS